MKHHHLILSAMLFLNGCSNTPATPAGTATTTPSPVATVTTQNPKMTIITPTPSVYPKEPGEGSVELVNFFNELCLGSKSGPHLVFLTDDDLLTIDLIKQGNPAFSTGSNSSMLNMEEKILEIVAETPEFKDPLILVLDSYVKGSYEVKEGQDPLKRTEEFLGEARDLRAKID